MIAAASRPLTLLLRHQSKISAGMDAAGQSDSEQSEQSGDSGSEIRRAQGETFDCECMPSHNAGVVTDVMEQPMFHATSAVLDVDDLLATVVWHVKAPELRRAARLGRAWRAAVERERTRRLALPRTQWALLGGGPPDLGVCLRRTSSACLRVDVVGWPDALALPPLPCQMSDATAVVLRDGSIVVGGNSDSSSNFFAMRFCPRAWAWQAIARLPAHRERRCVALATPDGERLLGLGGYVGQKGCQVEGNNACALVDELSGGCWEARPNLPCGMIEPVVLHSHESDTDSGTTLAFWRADDDFIATDGVVPLTPGGEVCISELSGGMDSPVAVTRVAADLIVAVQRSDIDIGDHLAVRGCRPRGAWVDLARIEVDELPPDSHSRPTVAVCALPSATAPMRFESSVVIGHTFWQEDNVRHRSRVGWWGAALAAVRAAVMRDDTMVNRPAAWHR